MDAIFNLVPVIFVIILLLMFAASAVRILPEYERGVLFRLGRFVGVRGPGLVLYHSRRRPAGEGVAKDGGL